MKKTIVDKITNKIKKGEITMKSQLSIWTEKLGLDGGIVIIFSLLIFLAGFILFWMNSNNDLLFGGYGKYGLFSFIQSFPYILGVVFTLLFLFLIIIFRKFDFSYKKPFLIILLFILVGIILLGWISIKQPLGQRIYQQEGRRFRMGMMNNSNAVSGSVIQVNTNSFTIKDENNENKTVSFNSKTHFPFGQPKEGNQIRSVGFWDGDVFIAIGVRVFDESNPSTLGPGMMRGRGQKRGMMWNQ
ncbi:hypothetical protein COS12_02130 [Candidatus Roizmanbacteria bacterium CG01_land_8_20_14_3_00_33_9]|uniref:Uncharacterized protein n=1 Tax=Candidatus Roizmanbacteria bacterium CG01_land_8_20_14_3_00_33_9 TaxID=1974843 RepID=A0A2M7E426_9BACT|nr:MAG: hypothetical protein COS12_02130 [Candidatus Roizmanbacteria bacterium CG01_land_8_20_14_3_00_33_9]